jgi:hypothetical protein
MPGYQLLVDHFETYINEKIREKNLDFAEADGIQKVFDFIESGKAIADSAYDSIQKYKDYPE